MSEIRAGRFWADEDATDAQGRAWAETRSFARRIESQLHTARPSSRHVQCLDAWYPLTGPDAATEPMKKAWSVTSAACYDYIYQVG